jgi:hypothetical protein
LAGSRGGGEGGLVATEIFVFDVTAATPWLLASYMPIKIVINCKLNINNLHTVGFYLKY